MAIVSSYQAENIKEGPSGRKRKYRSASMSKEDGKANIMIDDEDDSGLKSNFYKYKDQEAAEKDYDLFKSEAEMDMGFRKGGKVSSASKRADGIAQRGKTRGRMV